MRGRDRILKNLEDLYRAEYDRANESEDAARMAELDFGYQRDQLYLEVMLDLREALSVADDESNKTSLLEKAQAIRRLTKLR